MKKSRFIKIGLVFFAVAIIAAIAYYVFHQEFSADSVADYRQVGTISYSFKVVAPNDQNAAGIAGMPVTVETQQQLVNFANRGTNTGSVTNSNTNASSHANTNNSVVSRNGNYSEQLTTNASGLITGDNYAVCTKDDYTYAIMTSGCVSRVTALNASLNSLPTQSKKAAKRNKRNKIIVIVDPGYDILAAQFKDLFSNLSGGVSSGIAGQWSMQTSLIYSDGSGGKIVDNSASANKKFYEVGTIDLPVQVLSDKKKTANVQAGQNVTVNAFNFSPRRKFVSYNSYILNYSEKDKTNNVLANLSVSSTSDAQGMIVGGHYSVCYQNRRYYIMAPGCTQKVLGISIYLAPNSATNSNKVIEFAQKINQDGKGYSDSEFLNKFVANSGNAAQVISGGYRTKVSTIIYSDGTGGKGI